MIVCTSIAGALLVYWNDCYGNHTLLLLQKYWQYAISIIMNAVASQNTERTMNMLSL